MMKKLFGLLLTFFPILAAANDGSLSFNPPPSDYSVVFLGNIFGIVDGVLHGSGSQIMGSIFSVFNAAVLALGGIVILYTLLVSTMNTAHEGQMLGQKWSSIWIPIRATTGLALLIPKASGYCLMQIFVMWVVVQGVGAADKVWNAALSYLNRGGVIVQAQMNPATPLLTGNQSYLPGAAQIILAGQVCMLGLQNQLQSQLTSYTNQLNTSGGGPCAGATGLMATFCNAKTVPSFLNTVDVVGFQNANSSQTSFLLPMPNFSDAPFSNLNGICGTIGWSAFTEDWSTIQQNIPSLSDSEMNTAKMSRAIAIQQMYMDLWTVATIMVDNDPMINNSNNTSSGTPPTTWYNQQFGVPETANGAICTNSNTPNCVLWGGASFSTTAPLLNGTEFPGALQDYNGIMLPTLNLVQQANNSQAAQNSRSFIQNAETQGWIMAGSYFFYLSLLNAQSSQVLNANAGYNPNGLTDTNTGLNTSSFNATDLTSAFSQGSGSCQSKIPAAVVLCTWMNKNVAPVNLVRQLIDGTGSSQVVTVPTLNANPATSAPRAVISGTGSTTVYGYTNNSTILQLPGQPGVAPLTFAKSISMNISMQPYYLPSIGFGCGSVDFGLVSACLGSLFGNLFYNLIFRFIYNEFINMFQVFINNTIDLFLMVPLAGMSSIFKMGIQIIDKPGVNPVIALAQMGTFYINFSAALYLQLIEASIIGILVPIFGLYILPLLMMSMPILLAWLGIMVQIGFSTSYYVPILPYMIFTFGSIAWLMAVIEAMVAAPIVALGVTHPEGHDAFGKGEQAIMILLNVFLRPAMMIIGYIAGISLTFVSVWIVNAGFDNAISFIQGGCMFGTSASGSSAACQTTSVSGVGGISGGYNGWAGLFAYFFSILVYTMMYLTVVQKSFTLISVLPDKVLRWIGGQPESYGSESAQWGQEVQGKIGEAAKDTAAGQAQMMQKVEAFGDKMANKIKGGGGSGGSVSGSGGK